MFLTEWICTLGFQQVPVEYSAELFEGLLRWGWDYLFELMLRLYRFLYPWFRRNDVGNTILKLKNYQELTRKIIHKYKINWKQLLDGASDKLSQS